MRKLLLASAALLAISTAGNAAVVGDLGINPTSGSGAFSNQNLPTGAFEDQWTFELTGANNFFTIASATNVYPQASDFITNFNGSIFQIVGSIGGGDDILLFGPEAATNNCGTLCQGFGGSGFLPAGEFYLNIAGTAGSTAGYGGDIATVAVSVPEPATWFMMLIGFAGIVVMGARNRANNKTFRLA